jgi:hypothetical protein
VSGNRSSESLGENQELALADAHELYRAGAARLGTNEDTFIHVFTTRNAAQLRTTLQLYQQTFGHALETVSKYYVSITIPHPRFLLQFPHIFFHQVFTHA